MTRQYQKYLVQSWVRAPRNKFVYVGNEKIWADMEGSLVSSLIYDWWLLLLLLLLAAGATLEADGYTTYSLSLPSQPMLSPELGCSGAAWLGQLMCMQWEATKRLDILPSANMVTRLFKSLPLHSLSCYVHVPPLRQPTDWDDIDGWAVEAQHIVKV